MYLKFSRTCATENMTDHAQSQIIAGVMQNYLLFYYVLFGYISLFVRAQVTFSSIAVSPFTYRRFIVLRNLRFQPDYTIIFVEI